MLGKLMKHECKQSARSVMGRSLDCIRIVRITSLSSPF